MFANSSFFSGIWFEQIMLEISTGSSEVWGTRTEVRGVNRVDRHSVSLVHRVAISREFGVSKACHRPLESI